MKEFFHDGSILRKEADLYNSLMETRGLDIPLAERFIFESRKDYNEFNLEEIFNKKIILLDNMQYRLREMLPEFEKEKITDDIIIKENNLEFRNEGSSCIVYENQTEHCYCKLMKENIT